MERGAGVLGIVFGEYEVGFVIVLSCWFVD